MKVIDDRELRDRMIEKLKKGQPVYAESSELVRLIKRGIEKENLRIRIEVANGGCWFTPRSKK